MFESAGSPRFRLGSALIERRATEMLELATQQICRCHKQICYASQARGTAPLHTQAKYGRKTADIWRGDVVHMASGEIVLGGRHS